MNMKSYGKLGKRLIYSSILSAVILLLFIITATIWIRQSLDENIQGQRVLDSIDGDYNIMYKSIIDQETGQRGYNLTGDETFLEPYHKGEEAFKESTETLLQKAADFPQLYIEIQKAIDIGTYWQEHYGIVLVGLAEEGVQPGKGLMQEARNVLNEFRQASDNFSVHIEQQRSAVREKMKTRIKWTLASLVLTSALIICLNLLFNIRVLKSIVKPIIQLDDCVTYYAKHEFTKQIPAYKGNDELSALIANIDRMRAELAASIDMLESEAHHDMLTGLFNRRYFNSALEKEWALAKRTSGRVSLLLVDIDHYKNFNDTYGHLAGDECLKVIANVLNSYNNDRLSVAARYGGEEFAILLPDREEYEVLHLAEEVRKAVMNLEIPHHSSETNEFVTVSVGAAVITPAGDQVPEELIELADQALYHSKQNGRNCATYYRESV